MIDQAAIEARAAGLGFTPAQVKAMTPTTRVSLAGLVLAEADFALDAQRVPLEIETLRLRNLCERAELAKQGVDASGVPVTP